MKKHLKIMICYFKLNLASALEYRASFVTQAFGMALSNSSFIFFWWIAFEQLGGKIAGYSFEDILFIWAAASSAFGLSHILFANASSITGMIVSGELDVFLLQPCNILLNIICARTRLSAYGDLLYGFILMGIVYRVNTRAWLWFFVAVLIGGLLITAISIMAHTVTFYVGDASLLGQMATEFSINFAIYPEKIYGSAIRVLMYSLIPAGFIVHIPLRLFHEFSPVLAMVTFTATAVYCGLSALFFYRGMRRYESGNVIVTRL